MNTKMKQIGIKLDVVCVCLCGIKHGVSCNRVVETNYDIKRQLSPRSIVCHAPTNQVFLYTRPTKFVGADAFCVDALYTVGSSFNSPARTSRSATHLSPLRGFPVASPERGLSSLSESLHHVMYSSMASPPPRKKAGLYASLSQATASLLSTSPDLVPLAVHTASMSPFVAKAAPASWEETMSRLSVSNASHRKSSTRLPIAVNRDRRHSHSYSPSSSAPHSADKRTWKERWDDAISSYRCALHFDGC
jgi:hypothetical protein